MLTRKGMLAVLLATLIVALPLQAFAAPRTATLYVNKVHLPGLEETVSAKAPFALLKKKVVLALESGDYWPFKIVRKNVKAKMNKSGVVSFVKDASGRWTGFLRPRSAGSVKIALSSAKKNATLKITVVPPVLKPTLPPSPTPTPRPDTSPTPTPSPTPSPTPNTKTTYRALAIGSGLARIGDVSDRTTFPMDAVNFANMLSRLSFDGKKMASVQTLSNPTRNGALKAIREAFSGATQNDVSFLYLICHGSEPQYGVYRIWIGSDMMSITSKELRQVLDKIPGKINLILSCCYSGDAVGKNALGFAQGFVEQFLEEDESSKSGELIGKKYRVICGSSSDQPGWVIFYSDLSAAWCLSGSSVARGAGWMYQETEKPYSGRLEADANGDKRITMKEIYDYAEPLIKRLHRKYSLDTSTGLTQLCVYPYDDTVIFARD